MAGQHYLIPQEEYQRVAREIYGRAVAVTRQGMELMISTYPML